MDIRDRIRSVIEKDPDLTMRNVALAAGLSDSMLQKFLTGQTSSLKLDTVNALAKALGVDPAWLAYGEGTPERATDIMEVWGRIAERDKEQAKRVLETFARTGTNG